MIKVTIDYIPFGKIKDKKELATINIANVSFDSKNQKYIYEINEPNPFNHPKINLQNKIVNYDRNQPVLNLIKKILNNDEILELNNEEKKILEDIKKI